MGAKVITDTELRAHWLRSKETEIVLSPGTVLTPAAKDFIKEHGLKTVTAGETPSGGFRTMTRTAVPMENGHPVYRVAGTDERRTEKGELLTQLNGNVLVPKTDKRIAFRGKMDTLQAEMLLLQLSAAEKNMPLLAGEIGELLAFTRTLLAAEVKEEPVPAIRLIGLDSSGIRYASHHPKECFGIDHPIPDCSMGSLALRLNLLRTVVREAELCCAAAFGADENCPRKDLIEGLNRLSSCVYILFVKLLAGKYE